jgi:glycosyltransferase involved in cell wall biosynthesis
VSKDSWLRIGLDVTLLGNPAVLGTRHWTRGAFEALMHLYPQHHYTLIWSGYAPPPRSILDLRGANRELFWVRPHVLWRRVARKLGVHNDRDRCARRLQRLDVLHWNLVTEICFPWLHRLPDVPTIITAYDAIVRALPESVHASVVRQWAPHYERARELGSWWIAISESVRDDMIKYYRFHPDRGRVIYPGHSFDGTCSPPAPGTIEPPARLGLNGSPYLLSVGLLAPHKNQVRLIEAFRRLTARPQYSGWKLVLVGPEGWLYESIVATIESTPGVIRAGQLSQEELAATYRHAAVFAFPSLYEGFGLPVAEAMSFGLPVVTSNVSSLPEVAGPAGVLVDPRDEEALRDALERLMADSEERRRRGEAGREYAKRFRWDRSARQMMDFLEEVAASGERMGHAAAHAGHPAAG